MAYARIAGVPLLADRPVRWVMRTGVQPYVGSVAVLERHASQVEAAARGLSPVVLEIEHVKIKGVFVTNRLPTNDPRIAVFQIADMRVLWSYVRVGPVDYNITRPSGDRRYFGSTDSIENRDTTSIATDIDYRPHSTRDDLGEQPWSAIELVNDVLTRIGAALVTVYRWQTITTGVRAGRQLPVRNLTIDDAGPAAMQRALSYIPSVSMFVDLNGDVRAVDMLDHSELQTIETGTAMPMGPVLPTMISRRTVRPQAMDVIFTPEAELRFDFNDGIDPADIGNGMVSRQLQHVMRVVLQSLTVGGVERVYGTWLQIEEILEALSGREPAGVPAITAEIVRMGYAAGLLLQEYASGFGTIAPDPDWVRIIGEIKRCYRQCLRIPRQWMDRFAKWSTTRLEIMDEETAARGRSPVFTDYAVRWPQDRYVGYGEGEVHRNITGYADATLNCEDSGAEIQVVDQSLGIFRVNHIADNWGKVAQVYPSTLSTVVDSKLTRLNYINDPIIEAGLQLSIDHSLAVILSAIPVSMGQDRMFRVRISQGEAESKLGSSFGPSGQGPVKTIRVSSDIMRARFGWLDGLAAQLEWIFGAESAVLGTPGQGLGFPDTLLNETELRDVALSVAAAEYTRYADTIMGSATHLGISGEPGGHISETQIVVDPSGEVSTTHILPPQPPSIDWRSLVNEGTRRFLRLELGPDQ